MVAKKDQWKYVAGAIILVVLAVQFLGIYDFTKLLSGTPTEQTGGTTLDTSARASYVKGIGTFLCLSRIYDSADPTTKLTIVTNYNLQLYRNTGGRWIPGPALDSSGENFEMKSEDNGYAWFVWQPVSGQNYYCDYKKTMANDPYIVGYQYVDADGDTDKEFCFQYDFKNHGITGSGYPEITFQGYAITYDGSFTGIVDWNSTADGNSTSIGTSTVSKFYDYYLAFSAEKKGVAIYEIEVKAATTDLTKVRFEKLEIPGLGNVASSAFSRSVTSTEIIWRYTFSYEFDKSHYLVHNVGANNRYDMQLEIEYTLAGSDEILITLTVYYLVAVTEAGTSTSDTFYAKAAGGA